MKELLEEIRGCSVCADFLPLGPRPVLTASTRARIAIVGQAPGRKVHISGIPWDDASGKTLRHWLNMDAADFYDAQKVALVPMGFCYPGKGTSGDLPPRKECAPLWHQRVFASMPEISLILLVGSYAQRHYLGSERSLTETVRNFKELPPPFFPLPHPSPRNRYWVVKNPWFVADVLPTLQRRVRQEMGRGHERD